MRVFEEEGHREVEHREGALVWAALPNFPEWPAIVCGPVTQAQRKELLAHPRWVFVVFLPRSSKSWAVVPPRDVRRYASEEAVKLDQPKELRDAIEQANRKLRETTEHDDTESLEVTKGRQKMRLSTKQALVSEDEEAAGTLAEPVEHEEGPEGRGKVPAMTSPNVISQVEKKRKGDDGAGSSRTCRPDKRSKRTKSTCSDFQRSLMLCSSRYLNFEAQMRRAIEKSLHDEGR